MSLSDELNLGPKSSAMLSQAGIHSLRDLQASGAVAAFLAVRDCGQQPSLNLLWALHGALTHQKWNKLSASEKQQLRKQLCAAERDRDNP